MYLHIKIPQVCPNEKSPPDNWSFIEKFLNALEFGSRYDIDDKIGEKIRNDVVNDLLGELRDLVQKKWISSNKNNNFWMSSRMSSNFYENMKVQTADWLCQNLLNIGEFFEG